MNKRQGLALGGGLLLSSLLAVTKLKDLPDTFGVSKQNVFTTKKIVVGTTGDYKPFTYLNRQTNEYEGFDIEVIRSFAKTAGLEVEFVPTTWATLTRDLRAGRFHMVVGGVTKNIEREIVGDFTKSYLSFQKTPLVRLEDKHRLTSIETINRPDVTIGLNPGGTNEQFVRQTFDQANIVMYADNLTIPAAVATGEVDVMITDTVEAIYYASLDTRLGAPKISEKWIPAEKSYLVQDRQTEVIDVMNLWMNSYEGSERIQELKEKWKVAS
ncbi:transporter substrate-binding domain-containing protein [Exiguobacterium antarcticum]|uniref:transporter substrate-binding domain-containing protein n=1 Tax=Exiguobacterium antarcticum TaxID=132920 RepID=UPI000285EB52|nr:transporter substrate-binding domain-containing protein [Exiguobacterium antarcticum]AFS70310.1 Arogenate dehydratase [Exiguobacterium antarcticum B7]